VKISKYTQLNDREWLREQHHIKNINANQIAKQVGCNQGSVVQALNRMGIAFKKAKERKVGVSLKYPQLNDLEWVRHEYISLEQSLNQIAKKCNAPFNSVRQALIRAGVRLRTKGNGQRLFRNQNDYLIFNKPVIEGCLLGDGSMTSHSRSDDSAPVFRKTNIGYDHVLFVASQIFSQNAETRIKESKNKGFEGYTSQPIFHLRTLTHPEMMPMYRAWYPPENDYIKVIPESIEITPDLLLHWFMDDGYSYYFNKKSGKKIYRYLRVMFCTQSFQKEELEMLCKKIKQATGLVMTLRFHQKNGEVSGTGYELALSQKQIIDFFDIIGPCPVSSLSYKWKLT